MASTLPGMQPTPPAPTAERRTSESLVDRDSHFDGLYRTKQNLRVEGIAEGEIECEGTLTVEKGARVKAKVTARNVTVAGELEGEVTCQDTFRITPTGQVEATVTARRLIVQEGGFYNGEFRMITEEPGSREPSTRAADLRTEEWLARLTGAESSTRQSRDEEEEEEEG
ncbi:MAG TPA: polymer-forming cytoskeletal protein [Caldilineae bacterium]|nr:polymer-forming cytoskeletal protein [Caldilineae bacterium]